MGWTVRDQTPIGAIFSAPVQTGPGANSASYTMCTGSFPGVKRSGRGVDNPFPSSELWVFVARTGVKSRIPFDPD
jgi:hypothetical protein